LVESLKPITAFLIKNLVLGCSQYFLEVILWGYGCDSHHEQASSLLSDGVLGFDLADPLSLRRG
jgi:hypothetical protein